MRQPWPATWLIAAAVGLTGCAEAFAPDSGPPERDLNRYDLGSDVSVETACGDGVVDEGEVCDDGNTFDGDRCANDCTANPAPLCVACEIDDDCGRAVDLCLPLEQGRFCGRDCTAVECPAGYRCSEVREGGELVASQCAPVGGTCGACPDDDGDEVCNGEDRCAGGDDAFDADADGVPDRCDGCPGEDDTADADRDGIPDGCDCGGLGADCDVNAWCYARDGGPECLCRSGFEGDGIDCHDVNECADGTAGCADAADCVNTFGGVLCRCPDGMRGDGRTCDDIDECAEGADDCVDPAACINRAGAFDCQCPPGHADPTGDATQCTDIDECEAGLARCDPAADCVNTLGGYVCTCPAGTADVNGDGTLCSEVDECATGAHDCSADASCIDVEGGFACVCNPGLEGDGKDCLLGRRVVVYADGDASAVVIALERAGLEPVVATTVTELSSALQGGGRLLVVDASGRLGNALQVRLVDWVERGGRLLLSAARLDEALGLAVGVGVSASELSAFQPPHRDRLSPHNVFLGVPTPLGGVDQGGDHGDALELLGVGEVLGRYEAVGPAAAVLSRDAQVVVNGFSTRELAGQDDDDDGVDDVAELLRNEVVLLLSRDSFPLLNASFDRDLLGWSPSNDSDGEAAWASLDVDGVPESGSIALTTGAGESVNVEQCVPVDGGSPLILSLSTNVPAPGAADVESGVFVTGIDGDCHAPNAVTTGFWSQSQVGDATGGWIAIGGSGTNLDMSVPAATDFLLIGLGHAGDGALAVRWDKLVVDVPGCGDGTTEQGFSGAMVGCGGAVTWAERADLCDDGWVPCTAKEWVDRWGGRVPQLHYWTEDALLYNGESADCWVSTEAGLSCGDNPMRVCAPVTVPGGSLHVDGLGNRCNWIECGLGDTDAPITHFGGCAGNTTAGALCCR